MAKNTEDVYSSKIVFALKELKGKEKVRFSDLTGIDKLNDTVTEAEPFIIDIDNIVKMEVHNPSATDGTDYFVMIVSDKNGNAYYTSSETFIDTLDGIIKGMKDCDEEWGIKVFKRPSKSREGQFFITCAIN